MESIINNISGILVCIAAVCTVTSIITQITKEIGILKKIPTSLQVTITSIMLVVPSTIGYLNYRNVNIRWYMIFAAVIGGIICGYITMFGWDNLINKFKGYYKKDVVLDKELIEDMKNKEDNNVKENMNTPNNESK